MIRDNVTKAANGKNAVIETTGHSILDAS